MGLVLGMQVLLPGSIDMNGIEYIPGVDRATAPLSTLFDTRRLSKATDAIYADYWCGDRPSQSPSSIWCSEDTKAFRPLVVSSGSLHDIAVENMALGNTPLQINPFNQTFSKKRPLKLRHLYAYRDYIFLNYAGVSTQRTIVDAKCTLFYLGVAESDREIWKLFWAIDEALGYADSLMATAAHLIKEIEFFSGVAGKRNTASSRITLDRDKPDEPFPNLGRYQALHFRAESDWIAHCAAWMGIRDNRHRDNCMNNTHSIAKTLVIEGLDPRLPLYINTELRLEEIKALVGYRELTEYFTVLTKDDLPSWHLLKLPREANAAIDQALALSGLEFVGNSVSSFSAYVMTQRHRSGYPTWHYNGGGTPLQAGGILKPSVMAKVPTFPEPLKWVFTIHVGEHAMSVLFINAVKVAVLSAQKHTRLIPVCVTTLHPRRGVTRWLISRGVRVVFHTPTWVPDVRSKVGYKLHNVFVDRQSNESGHPHEIGVEAAVRGLMRIDIPILGFVDEFVLYTDVEVMFKADVKWRVLLGGADEATIRHRNDFSTGKTAFSRAGESGIPLYFSAVSQNRRRGESALMDTASIMLLSMRSLRQTYKSFEAFIFTGDDLKCDNSQGDQGAYMAFYRSTATGLTHASLLPSVLNWNANGGSNIDVVIIHFGSSKCEGEWSALACREFQSYLIEQI
jgi:hypothetical protein